MLKTEIPDIIGRYSQRVVAADFTDIEADDAASSSSGALIDTESTVLDFLHDKDVYPDNFFYRALVGTTEDVVLRFGYIENGQTPAAAIASEQWLSEEFTAQDTEEASLDEYIEVEPLEDATIPEGGLVFLWCEVAGSLGSSVGICGFRFTERIVAQGQ